MRDDAPGRIVNNLDYWIKQRGYKKYEVVEATKIPLRTLNDYCRGRTAIPRYRLEALAAFLECSISALLDEVKTIRNEATLHELNTSPTTQKTLLLDRSEGYPSDAQVTQEKLRTLFEKSAQAPGFVEEAHAGISSYHTLARYLQCQRTQLLDVFAPGSTNLRVRDIVGPDGLFIPLPWTLQQSLPTSADLVEYLIGTVLKNQRILLLGEAGQGKTTVLKQVFTLMVDHYLNNPHKALPLPLYVPLREFTLFTGNCAEVLWSYIGEEFPLSFADFSSLIRNNQVLVLFDGFDEIKGELTQRAINEHAASKVFTLPSILSCRKNFYENYLSTSALHELYSQKVELQPLTLTDSLTRYISVFCEKKQETTSQKIITTSSKIVRAIQRTPRLQDLAQRPLLLMMILDIFTDPREMGEQEWNLAKLYQKYTEKWLKYEAAKPDSVLRWHEKAHLMQEVAWSVYRTRIPTTLPYGLYQNVTFMKHDLSRLLERLATHYQYLPFAQLIDDICFRTFLISNNGDSYYFIHKSFQEFYVAQYIFERLRSREHTLDEVAHVLREFLPVEVVGFLKEMLSAKDFSQHDRGFVVNSLVQVYQHNSANNHHATTLRQNACAYLAYLRTQQAMQFLERTYEREPNKWVQRAMMVGLALFCGKTEILDRYIHIIYTDPEAASINIGYHLVYYGDQALEEGYYDRGGERCEGTIRSIFRRLQNERYKFGWMLDLLTLRTLLKQRGMGILHINDHSLPFLEEFLRRDYPELGKTFHQEKRQLQELLQGAIQV